jgi:putative spermidine/putrescine transport system substrate-binding protein
MMIKRRRLLELGGAGLVGGSALGTSLWSREAQAKAEQIVVMTWGGLWGDSLRDNVDAAFQKRTGVKVVQDRGSSPVERITKLKVGLSNQTVDILQIHDGLVPLAIKQGVVEKLDRNSPRMGHVRNIIPSFWNDYWVPMIFSAIGICYNTKLVKNPPTGFADLWRPEFKGRIVLPEVSHSIGTYIIPIGAMAAGKDPKDEAAGFDMLKKMADLKPIWAKDTDSIMNAFRDEEAVIGLLYKSQTYTVQGWKTPVEWVYPKEGGVPYVSGTSIAKNTKNLELAEEYLDVTMDPDIQPYVTRVYNYPGTNKDMLSRLSPELQARAQFTQAQLDRLVTLDHEFMSEKRADWTQRWNRVVAGG